MNVGYQHILLNLTSDDARGSGKSLTIKNTIFKYLLLNQRTIVHINADLFLSTHIQESRNKDHFFPNWVRVCIFKSLLTYECLILKIIKQSKDHFFEDMYSEACKPNPLQRGPDLLK